MYTPDKKENNDDRSTDRSIAPTTDQSLLSVSGPRRAKVRALAVLAPEDLPFLGVPR